MDSARNRRLWARQFAIWHGVYQFYVFFFFVIVDLAHFSDLFARCFLIEIKQQSSPERNSPFWRNCGNIPLQRARLCLPIKAGNHSRRTSFWPPPSNTTGAAQCAGTVSERARPKVLMEQQFCVSFILRSGRQAYGEVCKLFWQSLSTYISYIHICIYIEHVCCPIERQIAPLIIRAAPCQSVPCRAVRRQCWRVSHISQLFSENCEMARLSFLERAKGCTVLHTPHSLEQKTPQTVRC